MKLNLERSSDLPLYRQVANQIRTHIREGTLSPGSRLPTVRQLADELKLTRLTVHTAYSELQAEGLIESYVGRGTFIAGDSAPAPVLGSPAAQPPSAWVSQGLLEDLLRMTDRPDLLSFASAIPAPETFPAREFKKALQVAMDDSGLLSYGPAQGQAALREQISYLLLDRGLGVSPEQVLVTGGAQQAVDVTLKAFTRPDDVVLVEEPTYSGMIELAAQRGQRLVGVPLDEQGPEIGAFEAACALYRPRLFYTVATYHNPTGLTMSRERREALLRVARAYDLLVLEDDVYGLLGYEGSTLPPLKALDEDGRVIYASSFSKVLAPGLRLGWVVASGENLTDLLAAKRSSDLGCSPLLQRGLALYLRRGNLGAHLQTVRALYRERLEVMLAAFARHLPGCTWTKPVGGLCVWVTLPEGISERDYHLEAIERGVGVAPGRAFFAQTRDRAYMRLNFGAQPPAQIEQGVAILGGLLRDHLKRRTLLAARAGRESRPLV